MTPFNKIKLNTLNLIRFAMITYLICVLSLSLFKFMFLNVLLAYIPFELALLLKKKEKSWLFTPLFLTWFLFYPNAPYLLTDFFYLRKLVLFTPQPIFFDWFNFTILTLGIFSGYLLGLYSLFLSFSALQTRYRLKTSPASIIYIIITSFASGFAIYLGRFARLHSFYLFTQPHRLFSELVESLTAQTFIFTFFLTIIQIVIISLLSLFFKHANHLTNHSK